MRIAVTAADRVATQVDAYGKPRAWRAQPERALGSGFDLREFHRQVLEQGMLPLPALRLQVEAWVRAKQNVR